ncbi:LutC/YkgG family protein [Azospirillum doebereinerae]|uniref:LutC/YkgG family protein n=1 Tax=Azospirillum doebereinerae TaxID=92933 RepID=UPI001EE62910|nr:lactate utilization protein [Azospirillum doebereinerae]MCG5241214.1 lactate utilization protein [Azospirillum doebereinerae]
MSDARSAILAKLRASRDAHPITPPPSDTTVLADKRWAPEERLPRIRRLMEAVHTEFLDATEADWPAVVREFLAREGATTLLYAPGTPDGKTLAAATSPLPPREREGTHAEHGEGEGLSEHDSNPTPDSPSPFPLRGPLPSPGAGEGVHLIPYDRPVETFKEQLFEGIDAGLTSTLGAIAETGSLILWPSAQEPRLLSLVPHIHVALLRADALYDTFWQAMRDNRWAEGMPTNALLVSGPSKTADIEQTLAYGVHGPKRLIVVVIA